MVDNNRFNKYIDEMLQQGKVCTVSQFVNLKILFRLLHYVKFVAGSIVINKLELRLWNL